MIICKKFMHHFEITEKSILQGQVRAILWFHVLLRRHTLKVQQRRSYLKLRGMGPRVRQGAPSWSICAWQNWATHHFHQAKFSIFLSTVILKTINDEKQQKWYSCSSTASITAFHVSMSGLLVQETTATSPFRGMLSGSVLGLTHRWLGSTSRCFRRPE